jgi:hypothetical protein
MPDHGLRYLDTEVSFIPDHAGRAVKPPALFQCFRHPLAKGAVVLAGEEAVDRAVFGGLHRAMLSACRPPLQASLARKRASSRYPLPQGERETRLILSPCGRGYEGLGAQRTSRSWRGGYSSPIPGNRSNTGNSCTASIQPIRSATWMCAPAGSAAGSSSVADWISTIPGKYSALR